MTWFLVSWISWSCPGGWFSPAWPAAAHPFVCEPRAETFVTSSLEVARRRVRAQGPGARLQACEGLRCRELPVTWRTEVEWGS